MEKLRQYLETEKAVELSARSGISESHISDLKRGARSPSFATARKLKEATNGEIDYTDWELIL